ncbi:hypothetical protein K501DRAFT_334348 [Backusella circina FSU 941]|nr:hypothetical protein K501DRAFT_334348 [Backusella circina FSU 941]
MSEDEVKDQGAIPTPMTSPPFRSNQIAKLKDTDHFHSTLLLSTNNLFYGLAALELVVPGEQEPDFLDDGPTLPRYVKRMIDLMDRFDSQLRSLTLSCILDNEFDVLEGLDECGCKVDDLRVRVEGCEDFIEALGDSDHSRHINKLALTQVMG